MTGGRQAPAKKHGGQQGAAAAYAVDLVVTGKNISVLKAIKLTMERPGWRNAKGLSERNIYEQVAKRKKQDAAAEAAVLEERAAAAATRQRTGALNNSKLAKGGRRTQNQKISKVRPAPPTRPPARLPAHQATPVRPD
jgi:hypothetical protein